MALDFPNQSRSFDRAGQRIRFWGHDGALEVEFVIELQALLTLLPGTPNVEARVLAAFDVARERIMRAADKVYLPRSRKHYYVLTASDF